MGTPNVSPAEFQNYLMGVKSPTTAKRYAEYAAVFLGVMQKSGYKSFSQLPPGMLSEFAAQLRRQKNSPSTVRVYTFACKKYLEWVASRGVKVTPQNRPDLPSVVLKHRAVMSAELFTKYFQQADQELKEPVRTAVMLLPCCGLRAHEMVSLKLEQIHLANVKMQGGKTKKTLFLRFEGKGGKQRNVPLMEEGVEILTGFLAGWRKRQRGPWLFPSVSKTNREGTKHISTRGLRNSVQRLREPLGEEITPHTMRRTYLTMLWRRKVDLNIIRQIAGHANIQTLLNHYIVMDQNDSLEAFHNSGGALLE